MSTDRFTMDVLREGFAAISDEMFVSLQRTSQSPIIYEVLDFGVGISDANGELVSQGNGIAGFLGPLGDRTPAAEPICPMWRWSVPSSARPLGDLGGRPPTAAPLRDQGGPPPGPAPS